MTNEEIIKKVIEKAIDNGWNQFDWKKGQLNRISFQISGNKGFLYKIIFSHDFAKAFWGDGHYFMLECQQKNDVQWKQHLMVMVLEKDPIKYLEKFL